MNGICAIIINYTTKLLFSVYHLVLFAREREMMSDESDDEMVVDGPAPPTTPTTPRALFKPPKHDLMMTEEVRKLTSETCLQ